MEIRINVADLQIGMFVSGLDRPWLDTPFLLQGFQLNTMDELALLREHCEWAMVDLDRSAGGPNHWVNLLPALPQEAKEALAIVSSGRAMTPEEEKHVSLMRVLRELFSFKRDRDEESPRAPSPRVIIYEEVHAIEAEIEDAKVAHSTTVQLVTNIMDAIREDLQPTIEEVNDAVAGMVNSIIRNPNALLWLSQLKDRDNYTYRHSVDTAVYMLAFGRYLGFPKEDLHKLGFAGLMLDIGKMKLPDAILNKEGTYTRAEFMEMKHHVQHSLDILSQMADVSMDIYDMVARHHERFDGSGYPYGLKAEWIGMYGSMAGIVDCYTALTCDRPYAHAKSPHEAVQTLVHWSDKYFHPQLVEQFAQCIGVFHVGALVELSSGDVGIVVEQNRASALKPKVLLILGPDKKTLTKPLLLDLQSNPRFIANQNVWITSELPHGSYDIDPREYFLE